MAINKFTRAVRVISTAYISKTVAFLQDVLGFEQDWIWGDPPVYAGLKAGGAQIYVTHDPAHAAAIRDGAIHPDIFLWVRDIDTVYAQHRANNAEIMEELTQGPWGVRQYVIRDPNGYNLKIAEPSE